MCKDEIKFLPDIYCAQNVYAYVIIYGRVDHLAADEKENDKHSTVLKGLELSYFWRSILDVFLFFKLCADVL